MRSVGSPQRRFVKQAGLAAETCCHRAPYGVGFAGSHHAQVGITVLPVKESDKAGGFAHGIDRERGGFIGNLVPWPERGSGRIGILCGRRRALFGQSVDLYRRVDGILYIWFQPDSSISGL